MKQRISKSAAVIVSLQAQLKSARIDLERFRVENDELSSNAGKDREAKDLAVEKVGHLRTMIAERDAVISAIINPAKESTCLQMEALREDLAQCGQNTASGLAEISVLKSRLKVCQADGERARTLLEDIKRNRDGWQGVYNQMVDSNDYLLKIIEAKNQALTSIAEVDYAPTHVKDLAREALEK